MTITPTDATTATARTAVDEEPSTRRLNIMRFGYAFMGVGLAIVKWPLLIQDAASLPVMDGVVTCLERVALTSAPPSSATTTGTGYRCPPLREMSTATAEAGATINPR
jgi:hypothetical protein